MFRFMCLFAMIPLAACATQHEPRKCPMGAMAQIESPQRIAMQTAAQTTEKYGYTDFTVLSQGGNSENYTMLIKMSDGPDNLFLARLR